MTPAFQVSCLDSFFGGYPVLTGIYTAANNHDKTRLSVQHRVDSTTSIVLCLFCEQTFFYYFIYTIQLFTICTQCFAATIHAQIQSPTQTTEPVCHFFSIRRGECHDVISGSGRPDDIFVARIVLHAKCWISSVWLTQLSVIQRLRRILRGTLGVVSTQREGRPEGPIAIKICLADTIK